MTAKLDLKYLPEMKVIYCFTCLTNNKKYIGETSNLKRRLQDHILGLSTNHKLHSDIIKLGLDNFIFEILEVLDSDCTKSDLLDREQYYKSLCPQEQLYNCLIGRETYFREPLAVIQTDLEGNFIALWESLNAAESKGFDSSCISKCALGKRFAHKNSLWFFLEDYSSSKVEDTIKLRDKALQVKNRAGSINAKLKCSKPIYQLNLDDSIVARWHSAKEASRELGFNQASIYQALRGNYKQAYNFKWIYEKEIA